MQLSTESIAPSPSKLYDVHMKDSLQYEEGKRVEGDVEDVEDAFPEGGKSAYLAVVGG
jgi:hypothetical protein